MIATVRVLLLSALVLTVSVPASADRTTDGALIYVQGGGPLTVPLQTESVATATFRPYCSVEFPGALFLESIRYDFNSADVPPTPEPTSMLLRGSGLPGILAARAGRKRRSSS